MSIERPKQAVLAQLAEVSKAMAHANRLELLELVAQGERSLDALAAAAGMPVGNAAQHLHKLRRAGLLTTRRDGKRVLFSLSDDSVMDCLMALRRLAERNVGEIQLVMDAYFRQRDSLEPLSRDEVMRRVRDGSVTLLDVRPEEEFAMGHLPTALNMPLERLIERLGELPRDQGIVAYCRGPYCVFSFEAVAILRARGFKALRLEDGYPEWKAVGLPVEGLAAAPG